VSDPYNLQRFVDAQCGVFETALAEVKAGRKLSHWMWFVYPQLAGLGHSAIAQHFGILSRDEAQAYLDHPELGPRLRQAVGALRTWAGRRSAEDIFGSVDALKLGSCLTLFDAVEPDAIFGEMLWTFYNGADDRTLALLLQKQ
jgi:uncharacterized protein (DUF1810 family)